MADESHYTDYSPIFKTAHPWEDVSGHIPFGNLIRRKEDRFTIDELRQRFFYCPTTGSIRTKTRRGLGVVITATKDGYIQIRHKGCAFAGHRLAFALATGSWPDGVIDHINHIRDDNRISNLRDVTPLENRRNRSDHGKGWRRK